MNANTEQRKLAAIMFTDMVGYSALSQRNEQLAQELLEEHRALLRPLFARFNGTEIKTIGDAFLVEFHSALEAAQCGIEIQRALAKRNHDVPNDRRVEIKIGIHIGDVVHRGGDVYGDGVNIASRIEPLAGAGGICVSMDVERQIRNALEARFEKLAPTELKNISVAMDLFRIVLPWETPAKAAASAGGRASPAGRWAGVAILLLLAAGVAWWSVHQSDQPPKPGASSPGATNSPASAAATPSATDLKSIAVLPFVNMSADKADEYLSDGMTEELLNVLAKVPGLRVPGRSSSFAFKGKTEEGIFRKVGEQLHVATVLEGSVRKAGDKLRITAQLINVADGFHLWSETYDRDMTNIFAIQSDIADRVAQALKVQLLGAVASPKKPTENIEAYKLYLQGRQLWNRRTDESLKQAISYFDEAIRKDPGYALAFAGLADCYVLLPLYSGMPPSDAMTKARAAALKALELEENLAEARAALAYVKAVFDWDWLGAEQEFRRTIGLNANYATAHHWLAVAVLRPLRRFDEALAELQRAQELDPLSQIINVELGSCLQAVGRSDLGIQVLQKQIAFDPSFLRARAILGEAYFAAGRLPEAVAELEMMHRIDASGTHQLDLLGFVFARAGRTNEARAFLAQLQDLQRQGLDNRVGIALIQHGLGDDESALASLERDFQEKSARLGTVNWRPMWNDFRPHPRVQAIFKRMNLVK